MYRQLALVAIGATAAAVMSACHVWAADVTSATLKPACRGLMTSGWGGLPPPELDFVNSEAVNVPWSALETADQKFDGPGWEKIEAARRRGLH